MAGSAGVESDEAFEDALALFFGYAGSVVCDKRLDVSVPPSEVHVDSAGGLDGGEGVVDEVAEDPFESVGSPRTVVSASALRVISAWDARACASSTSGRAMAARSIGARVGCASRRASPRRSLTRRPSRSLSRATDELAPLLATSTSKLRRLRDLAHRLARALLRRAADTRNGVRPGVQVCPTACPTGPKLPMAKPNRAGIINPRVGG